MKVRRPTLCNSIHIETTPPLRVVPRRLAALLLLGVPLLAGCLVDEAPTEVASASVVPRRPVVVALIDTGVNPYHEAFRLGAMGVASTADLSWLPDVRRVNLTTTGDYAARLEADRAFWRAVEPGVLYGFAGTRLLGISLQREPLGGETLLLDDPGGGHGTGTMGIVAREAPDAVLVAIKVDTTFCDPNFPEHRCGEMFVASEAMRWAAEQDWIDVVSLSVGVPANLPTLDPVEPEAKAYLEASRMAHQRGKIVVNAAGNELNPPLFSYFSGPPWIVSAGGFEAAPRGEGPIASKAVDVVANYTEWIAQGDSTDAYAWSSGTSYSAPNVAGALARALAIVRARLGDDGASRPAGVLAHGVGPAGTEVVVTSGSLRHALNATAVYVDATDWDPRRPTSNETTAPLFQSLPVLVPHVQMGWGYVHGGLAEEIAARVVAEDLSPPASKAAAAEHQARVQELREAYWRTRA